MVSNRRISQIIKEEITKSEVERIARDKISSELSSRDFEKNVKKIVADVLEDLFKTLWYRSNSWKGGLT